MLIAIMSDTFDAEMDEKENNARLTKLGIMGDYIKLIEQTEPEEDQEHSIIELPDKLNSSALHREIE